MKKLFALAALASLATSAALAVPHLTYTSTDLGTKVGFTVAINWDDALTASGFFQLDAQGTGGSTIQQQNATVAQIVINTEADANLFGSLDPNYMKNMDSWWFVGPSAPFSTATPPYSGVAANSGNVGSNLYQASYGTSPSTPVSDSTNILYLVLDKVGGNANGRIDGSIARAGVDYPINNFLLQFSGGGGGDPILGVTPGALAFGDVRVGTSASLGLTASNTGTADGLTGSYGGASGDFGPAGDLAFGPLAQGASAPARNYTYTPSARGLDAGTVDVTSNGGNATVNLSGNGVGPVFADDDADNVLDFGDVGPPGVEPFVDLVLTISNVTTDTAAAALTDLTINSASITGPDASFFSIIGAGTGVIAKDGSLAITVRATYGGPNFVTRNALLTLATDEGAALGGDGNDYVFELTARMVPEPSTLALAGLGCLALVVMARRRVA